MPSDFKSLIRKMTGTDPWDSRLRNGITIQCDDGRFELTVKSHIVSCVRRLRKISSSEKRDYPSCKQARSFQLYVALLSSEHIPFYLSPSTELGTVKQLLKIQICQEMACFDFKLAWGSFEKQMTLGWVFRGTAFYE